MAPDLKSIENLKYLAQSDYLHQRLVEEESQVQNVRLIFKNLILNVSRLHIRYEDDYYQADLGKKLAYGITIEKLFVSSGDQNWNISRDPNSQSHFGRENFDQARFPETTKDSANLLCKEMQMQGASIYFETKPNILIPIHVIEAAQS
jgi:hypothetical protein